MVVKKIALITSHPIQYNAPLFTLLAKEQAIDLMVFYTLGETALGPRFDPDFRKVIEWDVPLLAGYNYIFLKNVSRNPGSHHFNGIVNPTLIEQIDAWGPDIIWIWGWSFRSHLKALMYFKKKIPVWFRGDSTLLDEPAGFSIRKIARRTLLKWVYSHIDKAFYVGSNNRDYFLAAGLKPSQLVKAPHSIDNDRFSKFNEGDLEQIYALRDEMNIREFDKVFLFAGKLEAKKNPFFIIDLAKKLDGDEYKFIVVGNGILENDLKLLAESDNRIIFLDFQNQTRMPTFYRLATFYILPSTGPGETWGLAMNESLAAGTPVIASKKCGGSIDLVNSRTGIVLDNPIDWNKLVTEILLFDKNKRPNTEIQNFVACNFSYENILAAVIKQLS